MNLSPTSFVSRRFGMLCKIKRQLLQYDECVLSQPGYFLVLGDTRRENTTPGGRHEITRRQSYCHLEMTDAPSHQKYIICPIRGFRPNHDEMLSLYLLEAHDDIRHRTGFVKKNVIKPYSSPKSSCSGRSS